MKYESDSLNTQIVCFEETVGLLVPKPITDPKDLARVIKMRQPYVDAGLMAPLPPDWKPGDPIPDWPPPATDHQESPPAEGN